MASNLTIIVTGAARGLGRAMTLALVASGCRVLAMDLPGADSEMAELLEMARLAGHADRIHPVYGDVTKPADAAAVVEAGVKHFGAVHGLVNNAARGMQVVGHVMAGPRKKFFEVAVDSWRATIETNVDGPFIMAQAVMPRFLEQGWGRIVNIVTSFSTMQAVGFSPYGPTKAALEACTVIWSKDLAGTGVTVNALLPGGAANTRMIPSDEITDRSTLVQPEVMQAPIVWLMSKASDGISGQRFIAQDWDPVRGPEEAAKASSKAGW